MSWWTDHAESLTFASALVGLAIDEGSQASSEVLLLSLLQFAGAPREEAEASHLARLIDALFTQGRLQPVTGVGPQHYRIDLIMGHSLAARPVVAAMFCVLARQRGLDAHLIHSATLPLILLNLEHGQCLCDTSAGTATVWSAEEWLRIREKKASRPMDPLELELAFREVTPTELIAELSSQLYDHAVAAGDLTSALRHAIRRAELLPNSADALLERGRLYAQLGMRAEAAEDFGDFLLRWPGSSHAQAVSLQLSMML
ncbi:MAG: hypothetical protein ACI9MC_000809 [Kiritimatiellia bacterium]|jgi:hypothetical protein